MSDRVPAAAKADQYLRRVETLLDQALDDLIGKPSAPPCSRSAELLSDAYTQLQTFSGLLAEVNPNPSEFLARMQAIVPRLNSAQRLLAASAEFYSGWCAAGLPPAYPAVGYQSDHSPHTPALLAVEG